MNTRTINKKYDCHLQVWHGSDCILQITRRFDNKNDVFNYVLYNVNIKNELECKIYQSDDKGNIKSDINWFIE